MLVSHTHTHTPNLREKALNDKEVIYMHVLAGRLKQSSKPLRALLFLNMAAKRPPILNLERSLGLVEILTQILLICSHVYQDAPHTGDEVKAALIIVDKNVLQDRNGRCHLTFAAKH